MLRSAWHDDFCVDNFLQGDEKGTFFSALKCVRSLDDYVSTEGKREESVPCKGAAMRDFTSALRSAYTAFGGASLAALLVTLYVYSRLPGLGDNLHGRIVVGNILVNILTTAALLALYNVRPSMEARGTIA